MELKGKILQVNPEVNGEGKNGTWRKQEYILETPGEYPKKVCFVAWGDKIDQFGIAVGQEVIAQIEIESREYNSRWYTDVKAWRVEKAAGSGASSTPAAADIPPPAEPDYATDSGEDDMPF